MKEKIKEVIVVEGRDDIDAVQKAVDADLIATHGYGISASTWDRIDAAYRSRGIIILTDPDHAGNEIRKKLTARFPEAGQAYIARGEALDKTGKDIGVENSSPDVIARALRAAGRTLARPAGQPAAPGDCTLARPAAPGDCTLARPAAPGGQPASGTSDTPGNPDTAYAYDPAPEFTMRDLETYGLAAGPGSRDLRDRLGRRLGIGYGNSKAFLTRLNNYHITRADLETALEDLRR